MSSSAAIVFFTRATEGIVSKSVARALHDEGYVRGRIAEPVVSSEGGIAEMLYGMLCVVMVVGYLCVGGVLVVEQGQEKEDKKSARW